MPAIRAGVRVIPVGMVAPSALITGANGFVGARLARYLVASGQRVKAFVRPDSNLKALRGFPNDLLEVCVGDIRCSHTVYRALAGCNRLYHAAANNRLWDKNPRTIIDPAVQGTQAVLDAARRREIRKIVVTSSAATLGSTHAPVAMDEAHAFNLPDAETWVKAKHQAEQVALSEAAAGLQVVVVNPTVMCGPGDWKPSPSGAALLRYLNWPVSQRLRFPLGGGLNLVDVDDVVRGHQLAMVHGRSGERYILGGDNLSVHELFQGLLPEATGLSPALSPIGQTSLVWASRLEQAKARLRGEVARATPKLVRDQLCRYVWVSSAKAEDELGYTHRPALETLQRAARWYAAQGYVPDHTLTKPRAQAAE